MYLRSDMISMYKEVCIGTFSSHYVYYRMNSSTEWGYLLRVG